MLNMIQDGYIVQNFTDEKRLKNLKVMKIKNFQN